MSTIPVTIFDEFEDEVVQSSAQLDLDSGEIVGVKYVDYDVTTQGFPAEKDNYEFTSGLIQIQGKELEFAVDANKYNQSYCATANELVEIKEKVIKLVGGEVKKNTKKKKF